MDELAELRKRRMAELQAKAQEQHGEEQQLQSQIAQLESIVKARLDKQALSRYSNLKVAHQEIWLQSLVFLAQLIQSGKISMISDAQYKTLLQKLQPDKKEIKINRI